MTPADAISIAFRSASKELDRQPVQVEAYETFLISAGEHLELAAQSLNNIAQQREQMHESAVASLEQEGLREVIQATVSALLALGHYPYLSRIDMRGEVLM